MLKTKLMGSKLKRVMNKTYGKKAMDRNLKQMNKFSKGSSRSR